MSQLPRPVAEVLREPVSEQTIHKMWRSVSSHRASGRIRRRPMRAAAALVAVACLIAFTWFLPRGATPTDVGPLRLAGGADVGELAVAADAASARSIVLSDGSRLTLSPGTSLTQLESSSRSFSVLLGTGRVEAEVVPGGPRQWSFECGLATVEVVGTVFVIDRTRARVRVEVSEGIVLVRGERVPDRVRRLVAGESIEILAGAEASSAAAPAIEPEPEPATTAAAATPEAPARPSPPAWRELARRGAYADAYRSLGDRGIAQEANVSNVDDLLALADVARLSGHPGEAVAPLRRVIDEHPGDGRAAVAAFTLGRVQLESLGQAAAAAQSFSRALGLGLPGPLVEDARARLVEAHARAGNHQDAHTAAAEYDKQFPGGRHAAAVRRWAGD